MFSGNNDSILELNDIRYICGKISSILDIPIYFINTEGDIIFEYSYEYSKNPLYNNKQQIFNHFLEIDNKKMVFNIISTKYYENYFSIKVNSNQIFIGTLFVGPTISITVDEISIDSLIKEFNIQVKLKKDLINYYNSIVTMDYWKFMNVASLLYHSIYNHIIDLSDVEKINKNIVNDYKDNDNFDITESLKRKNSIFHHSQNFEKGLLECIKDGDLEKFNNFIKSNMPTGERGVHSRNPLRSEKNLLIGFIATISRTAVEGGLDWELSLSLCDFYTISVEECNSIEDVNDLSAKILSDYMKRIHKNKIGNYSSTIQKCKNFIFEHLYEKISLTHLADYLGMNPSYLSHLFKKEVGISISEYIQTEKIKEAKKLIEVGEKSLADIYVPLGFLDQSHFTKAFKKVIGITPKEYRLSVR